MHSAANLSNILNPTVLSTSFVPSSPPLPTLPPSTSSDLAQANTVLRFEIPNMAAVAVGLPAPPVMQTQHSPEGPRADLPRPYKCPLCDKAFHRLEHQTRHIRTHTGEKPHACNFPGCSKRFSRSDELTRHSRIHANPNSRRGRASHSVANTVAAAAVANGTLPEGHAMVNVMGPPSISWSNPGSNVASPNVSPPQMYHQYSSNTSTPYGSYNGSAGPSPEMIARHSQDPANMNLLATAASQAAREHELSSVPLPSRRRAFPTLPSPPYSHSQSYKRTHSSGKATRLPSLAAYHYAQPMSRSQSHEGEDPHIHRVPKRSRPGSPYSTAPPSPTFSGASYSPTSGNTPGLTPGQSPRMSPHDAPYDTHLPGIRHLSLQHMQSPLLEPLEPSAEATGGFPTNHSHVPYSRSQNSSSSGLRISDIMNREDGSQRKLPIPTPPGVGSTELQSIAHSKRGSRSRSSSGSNAMDRS